MKKSFILVLLIIGTIVSCTKKEDTMIVTGHIKGLKKGTLYLQRVVDTLLVSIDSLSVDGNSNFLFETPLESPEVFYLYLEKNDGNALNDRIEFFGETGTINIETSLEFFELNAKITGSETHKKLEEYRNMISKFRNRNLELIKDRFEALKDGDSFKADSLQRIADNNLKRGYLYTLNFALNNKDSYVAPFIALSEAFDARVKYLDTINNSLTPEVANSKYGKALKTFIENIKLDK
ncbi:DUF4369 domain-containing protein [Leptobacterium sp. I13]|uniref:DUF4369 domain-containing protein n=1 Tax=Leptobacterium meishanense TaxID=3128904 RepID=UPI0030EBA460